MDLIRWGHSYLRKSQSNLDRLDDPKPRKKRVHLDFPHFGHGFDRKSSFSVEMNWRDVELAIRSFARIGHPDALRIRDELLKRPHPKDPQMGLDSAKGLKAL